MSAMERTGIALALSLQCLVITALQVPSDPKIQRELPRPPTITLQSEKDYIVDPRDSIFIECEADGNPMPLFSWTRNGKFFNVEKDPRVSTRSHAGTLDFSTGGEPEEYQGEYQCFAHNPHGTALSNKILLRVSRAALWPSESLDPVVVEEGSPLVLQCNPPYGLPKPRLFWMNSSLLRIGQNKRVSQGLNGNLYFANVVQRDSKTDYICCARFSPTGTIQHKKPLTLKVLPTRRMTRKMPAFLVPSGTNSSKLVLRGEDLVLECIASGLPEPETQWFKTGGELPSGKVKIDIFHKTMRIDSASEEDSGEYCCQASNIVGSVRHCFSVAVNAAPYWLEEPKNLVLAPGENGQMVCRAIGNPKPTVQWLINGKHINTAPSSHNLQVSDDILIFHEVQSGSSAVYQCNTSNVHGYLLANAFISILDVPPRMLSPRNQFIRVTEFSRTILDCAFFGSPTPVLRWFKDSQSSSLDLGNYIFHVNGSLEISRTRKEDQGVYTCAASNTFGSSENKLTLEVIDMVDDRATSPSEVSVYGLQRVPPGVSGPFEEDRFQPATRPNFLTVPDNVNSTALSLATYRNEPSSRPPSERSQTSEAPYSKSLLGFASRGWFISLMCTLALLIPILIIICIVQRSQGGTYPVQEIEDLLKFPDDHNDEDGSCRESDEDNKPKQGNQTSLEGGDEQFQDERSFISQYTVENDTGEAEGNESSEATSQANSVVDNLVANGAKAKVNESSETTSRVNSVVDNLVANGAKAKVNKSSEATSRVNSVVDNLVANGAKAKVNKSSEATSRVNSVVDNLVANGAKAKVNKSSEATSRVNSVVDYHAADGEETQL